MKKAEGASNDRPNADYTHADWDDVSDSPASTAQEIRSARPRQEAMRDLAASIRKRRGPQKAPAKTLISLRLVQRVIDHFQGDGAGWQARINDALMKVAERKG